jgi:hypothetical protein
MRDLQIKQRVLSEPPAKLASDGNAIPPLVDIFALKSSVLARGCSRS